MHSEEFVEQQRKLLEQLGTSPHQEDPVERWTQASEAVIAKQQRLLEEAAAARTAGGAGSGGDSAVATAGSAAATATGRDEVFSVRRVEFLGREVPMLLQNRNGPCALLAVANCLLLRGVLSLADGEESLSSQLLVERLARLCEELNAKASRKDAKIREAVPQVVQRLPGLLDGLLLNPHFSGCRDFDDTAEIGLFGLFGLRLFHSWVAPEVAEVVGSWNELAEILALYHELRAELEKEAREPEDEEAEALARGLWLEQWLEETCVQVTPRGLRDVVEEVKDEEVAVLFRNNHFSTVYKPRPEALCALLTDESFRDLKSAVWESVEADGGKVRILNADFEATAPEDLEGQTHGSRLDAKQAALLRVVQELGFSREQAEAGLAAVDWSSAEEAVEALLECEEGTLPQARIPPSSSSGTRRIARGRATTVPEEEPEPICPTCGKKLNSRAGLLSHRVAKGH